MSLIGPFLPFAALRRDVGNVMEVDLTRTSQQVAV
jgi:hypothetical protein